MENNDKKAFTVYETYDYGKFKVLGGNRRVNLLHVKRIINSFKEKHLVSPIIVNEKLEVIDGQHRLKASNKAKKPVYYIIIPGYSLQDVQIYNVNQKDWTKYDYLESYCDMGYDEYLLFKKFMSDFPEFGISSSQRILTQLGNGDKQGDIDGHKVRLKVFENGQLHIPNIHTSYITARKILDFRPHYKNFHRGTFVSSLLAIFKNRNYQHSEMVKKLSSCPTPITDQANVEAYKLLLEDIYNYKRKNKVSLRYE